MSMDQAAIWLASSILVMLGFIIIIIGGVVINNVLHKYWKPVRIFTSDSWNINGRFVDEHEAQMSRKDPKIEDSGKTKS
jgi:hypothetical protein